jgi:DNA-binding SARP family transcriptional activator
MQVAVLIVSPGSNPAGQHRLSLPHVRPSRRFEPDYGPFRARSLNVNWVAPEVSMPAVCVKGGLGMPLIELRTLGTLDLHSAEGRELHSLLAQPKRVALLAYLCIAQPHGFHRRDTLLGLFWPDSDQEHARASLRKSLHILRRALGDDAILSRGDEEVAVDFHLVSCDAAAFEANVKANRLEEALELYRGDLLAGFFIDEAPEFDQWLHSERMRLRAGAAHVALAFSDQLIAGGNVAAALTWARRSLELSDTDEHALRKLIELQCQAGDRTGAIRTYEEFARHLGVEYGTQPSSETRSVIERIRSGAVLPELAPGVKAPSARERSGQAPIAHPLAAGARETNHGRRPATIRYAASALAILVGGGLFWGLRRPEPSNRVVRYTLAVDSTEAMVPGGGYWGRLAISPNGTRLAYIGGPNAELLVRRRDQLHAATISGTEGAETPFFSPDGQRVGFLKEERVYIAPTAGGPLVTMSESLTGVAGASWGPDGFIYVDGRGYVSLLRVEAKPGAKPQWFTALDTTVGEVDHSWPDILPNGKGVLFTITFTGTDGIPDSLSYAIAVADVPSGKHHVIVKDAMYARYAASGHLLYVTTKKTLMVVPFDQSSMRVTGEPTALVDSMRLGRFGSADVAVSANGTLLYATGGGRGRQDLVWVTRNGKTQPVDPDWTGDFWWPALSPDGKQLAIARRLEGQRPDVWVKQLDRGPSIKLTSQYGCGDFPAWTPDGKSVTFLWCGPDSVGLWTRRADGSGPAVRQLGGKRWALAPVWSPDGKWLVYGTDVSALDSGDIVGIRPRIDNAPVPLVASRFREVTPALSPDGRWLAFNSNESGRDEVYVVSFPNTSSARRAISTNGGRDPQWSHGGHELFYRDGAGNLVVVEVRNTPTFSIGRAAALFSTAGFEMGRLAKGYAVSPDDSRFLMARWAPEGPAKLIVVDNWFDELKARSSSSERE